MTVKKLNYALKTDRGVMIGDLKRGPIIVGDDNPYQEFDTPLDVKEFISTRRIAVLSRKNLQDEAGELDETKVADFYVEHYARLQSIAVPFEAGLVLKTSHPYPISYGDTLYECIQGHTTQADWTPDIVPALFSEIQAPTSSGYPAWVQPTGSHDAYMMGDRMTYTDGKNYESLIDSNVWSPEAYPAGWKEI